MKVVSRSLVVADSRKCPTLGRCVLRSLHNWCSDSSCLEAVLEYQA